MTKQLLSTYESLGNMLGLKMNTANAGPALAEMEEVYEQAMEVMTRAKEANVKPDPKEIKGLKDKFRAKLKGAYKSIFVDDYVTNLIDDNMLQLFVDTIFTQLSSVVNMDDDQLDSLTSLFGVDENTFGAESLNNLYGDLLSFLE